MKALLLVLATVGLSTVASAAPAGLKGNGQYGTAGCGIGSLAFGNQSGPIQIVAATLNGTSGSQTFGITSGTSNCGPGAFAKAELNSFIQSNSVALENDIVRGQGETLSTLNNMLGCDSSFNSTLQNNYKSIYTPNASSAELTEKIVSLSNSCQG